MHQLNETNLETNVKLFDLNFKRPSHKYLIKSKTWIENRKKTYNELFSEIFITLIMNCLHFSLMSEFSAAYK